MKEWRNFLFLLLNRLFLEREEEQSVAAGKLRMGERIHALCAQPQNGDADQRREQLVKAHVAAVAAFAQEQGRAVNREDFVSVAAFELLDEAVGKLRRAEGILFHQAVDLVEIRKELADTGVRAVRGEQRENALAVAANFCFGNQGQTSPSFNLMGEYERVGRNRTAA